MNLFSIKDDYINLDNVFRIQIDKRDPENIRIYFARSELKDDWIYYTITAQELPEIKNNLYAAWRNGVNNG